ncbi:MAG: TetR/AcrR family transcriptional regulator [Chthonomonadales bacterium]
MAVVHTKTDTRELIVDAAELLFGRYGYKKTTVEDIATEMGVSRATLYLYFEGKEAIALAWIDRKNDLIYGEMLAISQESGDPADVIRRMLIARVMNVFDRACTLTDSIDDLLAALRPAIFLRREKHHQVQADAFETVIKRGQATGQIAPGNSARISRNLIIATNSLMPYNLSAKQFSQRDLILNETNDLANFLLSGLLSREKINSPGQQ